MPASYFLYFACSVTLAVLFYQNHVLQQNMHTLEEKVTNLTSSWEKNLDNVTGEIKSVKIIEGNLEEKATHLTSSWQKNVNDVTRDIESVRTRRKAEADQFGALKNSVEDAIFKIKLMSVDIHDLKDKVKNILKNDEDFRDEIKNFQRRVEDYQREMRDRNPLWDAFTGFLGKLFSPVRRLLN